MKKFKVIITLFVVVCCSFFNIIVLAKINQPDYTKLILPEKLKEDLDFLFRTIEEVHPNMYAYTPKKEFIPIKEKLYKRIKQPMSKVDFCKITAPAIVSLKNLHTYVSFSGEYKKYSESGGSMFPLEIQWDDSDVIIKKNYSSKSLPLGGKIREINSYDANELLYNFSKLMPAENRTNNPWIVETPKFLSSSLLLEFGPIDLWKLKIEKLDGTMKTYSVPSLPSSEFKTNNNISTIEGKTYYRILPEYNTAVIEFHKWQDPNGLRKFWDETFKDIHGKNITNLIIDIRKNTGGRDDCFYPLIVYITEKPYRLYDEVLIKISEPTEERIAHLIQQLPHLFENKKNGDMVTLELPLRSPEKNPYKFKGPIYLLIGRQCFSASTVFSAIAKCNNIAILVGEETGDPTTLYADSIQFELPNSGLTFWVASKLLVCPCGKADGRGVLPDYEVKQKPEDTAKGIDTVLQFTLNLIKESSSEVPR
jgi:hypothetical protein